MFRPISLFGVTTMLSATVWSGLALGLGSVLPSPLGDHLAEPTILWQDERASSIVLAGPNPCTGRPAVLDATLRVRITVVADGDDVQAEVLAAFENAVGATAYDRLKPTTERYALPLLGFLSTAHVHHLKVPVDGRLIGSHLAVALATSTDADGRVSVTPTETGLVCSMPYYEGNLEQ